MYSLNACGQFLSKDSVFQFCPDELSKNSTAVFWRCSSLGRTASTIACLGNLMFQHNSLDLFTRIEVKSGPHAIVHEHTQNRLIHWTCFQHVDDFLHYIQQWMKFRSIGVQRRAWVFLSPIAVLLSLRSFGHLRPHVWPKFHTVGTKFGSSSAFLLPANALRELPQNCKSCKSKPGTGSWSFTADALVVCPNSSECV